MILSKDTIVITNDKEIEELKKSEETKYPEDSKVPDDLIFIFHQNSLFLLNNVTTLNLTKLKNESSFTKSFNILVFFQFCESLFDIGTDGLSSYYYFVGSNYVKIVSNITDAAVMNSDFNCTYISTAYYMIGKNETMYEFVCFEKDPIYGALTLAVMALPGFYWAITKYIKNREKIQNE